MRNSAQAHQITDMLRARILKHVKLHALGNSHRTLRDIAVDLINQSGMDHAEIATGCFLCTQTITNLAEDITQHPQTDTLQRIFRFFNFKVTLQDEYISDAYQNQEKEL